MKAFTILLTLVMGSSAFAGSGGFTTTSCASESGRTVVSVYYGESLRSLSVTVDGQVSRYVVDYNSPDSDSFDIAINGTVTIKKNNSVKVSLAGAGSKRELTIQPGADPRLGTELEYIAKTGLVKIPLICKSYTKEP